MLVGLGVAGGVHVADARVHDLGAGAEQAVEHAVDVRLVAGDGVRDRITVSLSDSLTNLFSPRASSASADIGSPCEPVEITQTSPGARRSMSSMSTSFVAGMWMMPRSMPSCTFLRMLRPSVATTRPLSIAASAICWMRWRWLAKLAVMMRRPLYSAKSVRSTDADVGLARRVAGRLGVGGVAQQHPTPSALGDLADAGEVGAAAVDRGEVELEVAGVEDDALAACARRWRGRGARCG